MLLRAVCVVVLLGILVAGLWPFHAPRNQVTWLSHRNGLQFGNYGSIISARGFKDRSPANSACSLEIWLQPRPGRSSGTILGFYQPEGQIVPLTLRQSQGTLGLLHNISSPWHRSDAVAIYVQRVFNQQNPVLVTITANQAGTAVYANGSFVREVKSLLLSSRDLTGRLVVGNSPITTNKWSGQVMGLAIYDRELTGDEIRRHYESWTSGNQRDLENGEKVDALYLFDEGSGNVVHNRVDPSTDLLIPDRFFVLNEPFLMPPWDEFHPGWRYWKDISVNVAGFIPLGFLFYAYFSLLRKAENPATVTIALGFALSLTIEVLQAFLPTRNSGMTDIITNTLGTAVGVVLWRHNAAKAAFGKAFKLQATTTGLVTPRV